MRDKLLTVAGLLIALHFLLVGLTVIVPTDWLVPTMLTAFGAAAAGAILGLSVPRRGRGTGRPASSPHLQR